MNYTLQGNQRVTPIVGNLIHDDLGKLVLSKYNELFRGTSAEHKVQYQDGQAITHSNVPLVLGIDQILRQELPSARILRMEDVVENWDLIPELNSTYADTTSIVVYPNKGVNEEHRQRVLGILGKTKTNVPLVVTGLGVKPAQDYGFWFTETDHVKAQEAPYLKKGGLVSSKDSKLESSNTGVRIWTPDNQAGLRRVYRNRVDGLGAWGDSLLGADSGGRVQILQDPKGLVAEGDAQKILHYRLIELQRQKEAQIAQINSRYEQASKILRGN